MDQKEILRELQEKTKRPEGTVMIRGSIHGLSDSSIDNLLIMQLVSGAQLFRIERDKNMNVKFYHSSPGTGTRVASISLNPACPFSEVAWGFIWSPKDIKLFMGPNDPKGELIFSEGYEISKRKFQVDRNGNVIQIGDDGVEVTDTKIFINGGPILEPAAIDVWRSTIQAVNLLKGGTSTAGYSYEVVICNTIISTLVTGFEVYCKTRFIELEKEGIRPDYDSLIGRVFSQKEIDLNEPMRLRDIAKSQNKSFLEVITERKINFQNYEECKRAYNKAYNLRFGDIFPETDVLRKVQDIIYYRHRIIHVSLLLGFLNQPKVPPEDPVFSNLNFAEDAIRNFDLFVTTFHEATLQLRPK